ncbi:hypothetical protein H6503_03080 [Candidatus Woesearchaeota archaeon]|nr:hypothetical protein [Candidatus Woesearchaeota archaeon]
MNTIIDAFLEDIVIEELDKKNGCTYIRKAEFKQEPIPHFSYRNFKQLGEDNHADEYEKIQKVALKKNDFNKIVDSLQQNWYAELSCKALIYESSREAIDDCWSHDRASDDKISIGHLSCRIELKDGKLQPETLRYAETHPIETGKSSISDSGCLEHRWMEKYKELHQLL